MSLSDIKIQLQELYVAEISESLISQITDEVIDDISYVPYNREETDVLFDSVEISVDILK